MPGPPLPRLHISAKPGSAERAEADDSASPSPAPCWTGRIVICRSRALKPPCFAPEMRWCLNAVAYAGTLMTSLGALCLFGIFNLLSREVSLLMQAQKSET